MSGFDALIEAFFIFKKYSDDDYPAACKHDVFYVMVDPSLVSSEDIKRLEKLSFEPNDASSFSPFLYGGC